MHQGSPEQITQMLLTGVADIGIASHVLAERLELVALPCYRWTHSIVVPEGHALLDGPVTLERLADYPVITYDTGLTGRDSIDGAFARAGLQPEIVLTAMDADVIKTYVELGLGVGILASIAMDEDHAAAHPRLRALDARHLFPINTTSVAVRRGGLLRGFAYDFIQTFASHLAPDVVRAAQQAPSNTELAPL
jgi:LysR family cys regulon transcriptional activator